MKTFLISMLLAVLAPSFILGAALASHQTSDHPEWLACAEDEDCTSVELGCTYWQPVNKAAATVMTDAYPRVCLNSAPPGPQPPARCKEGACVNLDTLARQKVLGPRPDDVAARAHEAGSRALGETSPRPAPIDVRISNVRPDYPHEDLNPPLKGFIPALKKCIILHAGASPWGEIYADFIVAPDGRVGSNSFRAKFIAAENTTAFTNCLSAPFKKLRFPAPKAGQAIAASISYHVPFGAGR